jgi:hypothetical protein
MDKFPITLTVCPAAGCARHARGTPWSSYCPYHAAVLYRTGSLTGRGVRGTERRKYRDSIEQTLARYAQSPAVNSALFVASDLLQWRARRDFTTHHQMQAHMLRLRSQGAEAREILQRVCEIAALHVFDARFSTAQEMDIACARHVLFTRKPPKKIYGGPLLRFVGTEVREAFGVFPFGVLDRINRDVQVRQQAKKAFETGWTLPGESKQIG